MGSPCLVGKKGNQSGMTHVQGLHDLYFSSSIVCTEGSTSAILIKNRRSVVDCSNDQKEVEEENRNGLRKKLESCCELPLPWLPKNISVSSDLTKDKGMADRSKKRTTPDQHLLQYCNVALDDTSSMRTTGNPSIELQLRDSDHAQLPLVSAQQPENHCIRGLNTSENCSLEQQPHSIVMEKPNRVGNSWLQLGLSSTWPVPQDNVADRGSPESHHPSSICGDMEVQLDDVAEEQQEWSSTLQLLPQQTKQGKASRLLKRSMPIIINTHAAAGSHIFPNNWRGIDSRSGTDLHLQAAIQAAYIDDHHTSRPIQQAWYDTGNQSQAPLSRISYSRGCFNAASPVHVASLLMDGNAVDINSSKVIDQCYDDHQQQVASTSRPSAFHIPTPSYPPFACSNTPVLCSSNSRLLQPLQSGHSDPEHSASSISCQSLKLIKANSQRKAGIWFMLEAAPNLDEKDNTLALPQIQKNYLHVKDGKVRVSVVKKYVAVKLGLQSESEMEMRCRGQDVTTPDMTLQEVRDNVWFCCRPQAGLRLREEEEEDRHSTCTRDHIMLLTYNRRKCYNSNPPFMAFQREDLSTHSPSQNYIT